MAGTYDGLGKVVERRPAEMVTSFASAFLLMVLVGVFATCTGGRHGRPPIGLGVDAHGRPDTFAWLGFALVFVFSVFCAVMWVAGGRSRFRIGVERTGLRLERLGETRVVPFATVSAVGVEGPRLALVLRSGVAFRIRPSLNAPSALREVRDEVLKGIAEAREAKAFDPDLPRARDDGDATLLAPGGRDLDAWLRDLRALLADVDYRSSAMTPERLWHVVEDRRAASPVRAGAAVALGHKAPASAARLHAAASACEDNHLRVLFERVAHGADDEAIRLALGPFLS